MGLWNLLFAPNDFMPHGYCCLWNPGLVWLHVISDALIALPYFTIPRLFPNLSTG
ncbi:MAG TPA: hypothetical protein VJW93_09215 [Candidatus Acidoferrales bacterium]|nr:hypothetical protein [Candidatus Acidoferrales bacterium]